MSKAAYDIRPLVICISTTIHLGWAIFLIGLSGITKF